jgi:hypothetical protein
MSVPFIADFALAYTLDEQGIATHAASAHADPSKESALAEIASLHQPNPNAGGNSVVRAIGATQPVLVERITPAFLDGQGFEPRVGQLFSELNPVSLMALPLIARRTTCAIRSTPSV